MYNKSLIHRKLCHSGKQWHMTLCHSDICHSGESRMARPLYTVAIDISSTLCQMIWSSAMLWHVSFVTLLHIEDACGIRTTCYLVSWPSFDIYLPQCTKDLLILLTPQWQCHCGYEVSHIIDIQIGIFPWYSFGQ